MPLEHLMYWTGVTAWAVFALVGMFAVMDYVAEWFIDSVRFKAHVVRYWKDRRPERATAIDDFVQNDGK